MTNFKIYLYGNKFIFGYIKEWEQISREYRESKDYTCEHRSIHIENSKLLILNSNILLKNEKSFFCFFALTPSQSGWKPCVYRGFSGEGKCEGKLSPLTLTLTLTLTPKSVLNPPCPARHNQNQ